MVCYFFSTLNSCFSIYFSWRNTKKATEITEEALPVQHKSNIKFNTSKCWSFMYITCQKSTVNLKLFDNLIISPDTSNPSVAISANWLHYRIRKPLNWSSDWSCAISIGIISVESRHTNFNSLIKIQDPNKTVTPLRIFVCRNSWQPFTESWVSAKPSLRNTVLNECKCPRQIRVEKEFVGDSYSSGKWRCVTW